MTSFLQGTGSEQAINTILDAIPSEAAAMIPGARIEWVRDNAAVRVPGMLANLSGLVVCPEEGSGW